MKKKNIKNKRGNKNRLLIQRTFGEKAADILTKVAGSWTFIIILFLFMGGWIYLNISAYVKHWDPWPFIILNLCLSCLAAVQAPIILMSQNREAKKDRQRSEYDYAVNRKSERKIEEIRKQLNRIEQKMVIKRK